MKKLTLLALAGLFSATAAAAPVGATFTNAGVGIDLTSTKYDNAKRATGVGIVADYGFDYGNNLVGLVEGKIKLNNSKLVDRADLKVDEKWRANISYLQGYRVTSDFLPYIKVGVAAGKFKSQAQTATTSSSESSVKSGLAYGVGAKYAVSSDVELGVEYLRSNLKVFGSVENANTFGANATYRF